MPTVRRTAVADHRHAGTTLRGGGREPLTTRGYLPRADVCEDDGAPLTMSHTLEISDELKERLDKHLEEDETHEEFIEELVSMYETEGAFLQEGYSE